MTTETTRTLLDEVGRRFMAWAQTDPKGPDFYAASQDLIFWACEQLRAASRASPDAPLCTGCGKLPPHEGCEHICPACAPPNGTCNCPGCSLVKREAARASPDEGRAEVIEAAAVRLDEEALVHEGRAVRAIASGYPPDRHAMAAESLRAPARALRRLCEAAPPEDSGARKDEGRGACLACKYDHLASEQSPCDECSAEWGANGDKWEPRAPASSKEGGRP